MRRVDRRMSQVGVAGYDGLPRPPRAAPRRVHRAVQHHPDQRHRLLPRPRGLGPPPSRRPARAAAARRGRPSRSAIWSAGLRVRRGGLHPRHGAGRGAGAGRVPRAGEDLRHRRRRGGAGPRAAGHLHRARGAGHPARAARPVLRPRRRPLRLPQGPAPVRDLRAQRPRAGRPDLPDRPARLPQHPDVLQRRDAGADPRPASTSRSRPAVLLFLGKAEMLLSHGALFAPVDLKRRIFRKAPRDRPAARAACSAELRVGSVLRPSPPGCDMLRDEALLAAPLAAGRRHRGRRRRRWSTSRPSSCSASPRRDVGRPFQRPRALLPPGRSCARHIEQAQTERRTGRGSPT